jgi:hypothetical protein
MFRHFRAVPLGRSSEQSRALLFSKKSIDVESDILMTWEDGKSWLSEPQKVIVFFDRRRPRELFQTHPPRCSLANGGGSPPSFLENRKGLFFRSNYAVGSAWVPGTVLVRLPLLIRQG